MFKTCDDLAKQGDLESATDCVGQYTDLTTTLNFLHSSICEKYTNSERENCVRVAQRYVGDSSYWARIGLAHYKLGDLDEAITHCNRALTLDRRNVAAWIDKGVALLKKRNTAEALQCIEEAYHLLGASAGAASRSWEYNTDIATTWYLRGVALFDEGKLEDAIAAYDKALEIAPEHGDALIGKGTALLKQAGPTRAGTFQIFSAWRKQGMIKDAIDCFDEARELDPKNAYAWSYLGLAYWESYYGVVPKFNQAIGCFDQALKLAPRNAEILAKKADTLYQRAKGNEGVILNRQGKFREAMALYTLVLTIEPDNLRVRNSLDLAAREVRD